MASFLRYRPVLSGFSGAPGINTFHGMTDVFPINITQAQQFADEIKAVYLAMQSIFASGVTITFPGELTIHDELTGELMEVVAVTPPATVTSSGSLSDSNMPRSVQAVARLNTNVIRDGRRLVGRHFIGPINQTAVHTDGTIVSASRTLIANSYGGILDVVGPNLAVYGPTKRDEAGNPTSAGKLGKVTGVSVLTIPGTLRSRKV